VSEFKAGDKVIRTVVTKTEYTVVKATKENVWLETCYGGIPISETEHKGQKTTDNYQCDAMYYEKCLRDLRDVFTQTLVYVKKVGDQQMIAVCNIKITEITEILEHKYELDGVDLDKPNYGMFE